MAHRAACPPAECSKSVPPKDSFNDGLLEALPQLCLEISELPNTLQTLHGLDEAIKVGPDRDAIGRADRRTGRSERLAHRVTSPEIQLLLSSVVEENQEPRCLGNARRPPYLTSSPSESSSAPTVRRSAHSSDALARASEIGCEFQVLGVGHNRVYKLPGEDSLAALQMAIGMMVIQLDMDYKQAHGLTFMGESHLLLWMYDYEKMQKDIEASPDYAKWIHVLDGVWEPLDLVRSSALPSRGGSGDALRRATRAPASDAGVSSRMPSARPLASASARPSI
jgi:hypothetical protein